MNQQLLVTMFDLIKSVLFEGGKFDERTKEYIDEKANSLYVLSKHHDVTNIVANAIEKLGIELTDKDVAQMIKKQMFLSVVRYERINHELIRVSEAFESHGILHILMKGVILRKFYPEPWLRTSCDIDILVHEQDVEKSLNLLKSMGYREDMRSSHDISLFSEGGVNVELHYKLVEDGRVNCTNKVLHKVWEYTKSVDDKEYCLEMTNEMFYFFHIAHMAKHFEVGGCGIKPFIDQLLMKKSGYYKMGESNELLIEAGLLRFEGLVNKLCSVWFEGGVHDSTTQKMQEYLISGGTYGNVKNKTTAESVRKGGKVKYILHLIWLPYNDMKLKYPTLENRAFLYPFYQIRRWFGALFKLKKRISLIKTIKNKNSTELGNIKELFDDIGLDIK